MNEPPPLAERTCVPCRGGDNPLAGEQISLHARKLSDEWRVVNGHHLEREFKFKDFREALAFVNRVGGVAEAEGHHPDIWLSWGRVQVILYTHKINGLHENDFIVAAKIDRIGNG